MENKTQVRQPKVTFSVRLEESMFDDLARMAEHQKRTKSSLVRYLIYEATKTFTEVTQ